MWNVVIGEPCSVFDDSLFETKSRMFKFDYKKMNTFEFVIYFPNMMFESV